MIREAEKSEFAEVMRVLETALLDVDPDEVDEAVRRNDVLVATHDDHLRGALVLDGTHIEAIAVSRTHRAKGIGSALVRTAADRGPLSAEFRPAVRPFYESLGFEIECEKRCRGRFSGPR